MLKMHILTSVWGAQHPNAGRNMQHVMSLVKTKWFNFSGSWFLLSNSKKLFGVMCLLFEFLDYKLILSKYRTPDYWTFLFLVLMSYFIIVNSTCSRLVNLKYDRNTRPFEYWTQVHNLNIRLVCYSDPLCTSKTIFSDQTPHSYLATCVCLVFICAINLTTLTFLLV